MTAPRITLVTVSYNSAAVLERMLASCPPDLPVIIADNGSSDINQTRQIAARHGATLIESPENVGFGRGCNLGAAAAETEFIFFLNPDAMLLPDTIPALLETADAHPEAVAFNPILQGEDGTPALKRKSDLISKSLYLPRGVPERDIEIHTLNGAAILVRRQAFQQVGGFDPKIFLFFEDDDLGQRLMRDCGPMMMSHRAIVRHLGGAASSGPRLEGEVFKSWHKGFSRLYTMHKHAIPLARTRALLYAVARVVSPVLLVSRPHRARRLAFLRGTLRALTTS